MLHKGAIKLLEDCKGHLEAGEIKEAIYIIKTILECQKMGYQQKLTREQFASKSGAWMGEAHSWIQWNCINGGSVTWFTDEVLKTSKGGVTVKDIETIALLAAYSEYEKGFSNGN